MQFQMVSAHKHIRDSPCADIGLFPNSWKCEMRETNIDLELSGADGHDWLWSYIAHGFKQVEWECRTCKIDPRQMRYGLGDNGGPWNHIILPQNQSLMEFGVFIFLLIVSVLIFIVLISVLQLESIQQSSFHDCVLFLINMISLLLPKKKQSF